MLIIGGGIAGVSLGRELSLRGYDVTLLEAENELAYHTSGRSAQQLVLGYGPPAVRELTDLTVDMLLDQQQALDGPVAWPSKFVMVGSATDIEEESYPGQLHLDAATMHNLVPELRAARFTDAALDEHSLRTNAEAMLSWFIRDATKMTVRLGEPVTAATYRNGAWAVTTPRGTYEAQVVVNAAGAWADEVAELFGVTPLGLTPLRRTAAILEVDHRLDAAKPMVMKTGGYYYRFEDERSILASPQEAVVSPAEDAQPHPEDIDALIQEIQADTTLHITHVREAWTGLRTEAPDGVPVVGFDGKPGFFWLAGQSGYGFQTSLGFARLAADLLVDGAAGEWVSPQSVQQLAPARLR